MVAVREHGRRVARLACPKWTVFTSDRTNSHRPHLRSSVGTPGRKIEISKLRKLKKFEEILILILNFRSKQKSIHHLSIRFELLNCFRLHFDPFLLFDRLLFGSGFRKQFLLLTQ